MTTEGRSLSIGGVRVAVVRKDIKNLHLGVYPPDGRVRVAAPLAVSDAAVRVAVIGKLRWIARQRAAFAAQEREATREFVSGETHHFLGRRYRLKVVVRDGASKVRVRSSRVLELATHDGADVAQRARAVRGWYRAELRKLAFPLLDRWQRTLDVRVHAWGIKRMKTKWGSCNAVARRVWLNLELAKKSPDCLEYVVVHELVHLLVPHHDKRFREVMDRSLPGWRQRRAELNAAPLGEEAWEW